MSIFSKDKPMAEGGQVLATPFTYEQERWMHERNEELNKMRQQVARVDEWLESEQKRVDVLKDKERQAAITGRQGKFIYTISCANKPDVTVDADYCEQLTGYSGQREGKVLLMKEGMPYTQCEAFTTMDAMPTITRKPNPKYRKPTELNGEGK